MPHPRLFTHTACWLVLGGSLAHSAAAQELGETVVQGGRLAQKAFDTPAAVQQIDAQEIREAGAQVNLSEALSRVPGVVALNRNNYAQDIQISIRGFGARAAFGLRGIRLITDGIPATTPDGQGQASTVSLGSADRIELLSGPLAQLYGNAAGGVIQTFTREAGEVPTADLAATWGSFGMNRQQMQLSGRAGQVGIVADYSLFGTDGHRDHSAAERKHFNAVITSDLTSDTRLKLVANVFDMPQAQDPLGLTQAQWQANPRQVVSRALDNNTRKSVQQSQLGLVLEHRLSDAVQLQWRTYAGTRQNLQYQAGTGSVAANGNWVSLDRDFAGMGGQVKGQWKDTGAGPVQWVLGVDLDRSSETRQGGGTVAGEITGGLGRNELNVARNSDAYAQLAWHYVDAQGHNPWSLSAGLRRSQVTLSNTDAMPVTAADTDGSGSVRYSATSPVLGLTWHALPTLNVYANWGKGFETPTLAEAAYMVENNAVANKFNTQLQASRSTHQELGSKWQPSAATQLGLALFQIHTDNEIVTQLSNSGRTAFKNAGRTRREGLELGWGQQWARSWRSQLSATWMKAVYDADFTSGSTLITAGKHLPGVPDKQLFASLQWAEQGLASQPSKVVLGWSGNLDWVLRSQLWANDVNDADARAPGFAQLNAKLRHRSLWGALQAEAWLGVDNLSNRQTVGSVIVNQAGRQWFESGLPRNWMLGLKLSLPL